MKSTIRFFRGALAELAVIALIPGAIAFAIIVQPDAPPEDVLSEARMRPGDSTAASLGEAADLWPSPMPAFPAQANCPTIESTHCGEPVAGEPRMHPGKRPIPRPAPGRVED